MISLGLHPYHSVIVEVLPHLQFVSFTSMRLQWSGAYVFSSPFSYSIHVMSFQIAMDYWYFILIIPVAVLLTGFIIFLCLNHIIKVRMLLLWITTRVYTGCEERTSLTFFLTLIVQWMCSVPQKRHLTSLRGNLLCKFLSRKQSSWRYYYCILPTVDLPLTLQQQAWLSFFNYLIWTTAFIVFVSKVFE